MGLRLMNETIYKVEGAPHLALITDLHGRPYEKITESMRQIGPEIICIAGDILYGTRPSNSLSPLETQQNVMPFLRACASVAPSFLSLGNHEWMLDKDDIKMIEDAGVVVLDNAWKEQDGFAVGGLTSAYVSDHRRYVESLSADEHSAGRYLKRQLSAASAERVPETEWLREFCDFCGYRILLCHHPEYYSLVPEGIDLILAGHAHGGQWRFFGRGVFAPGQGLFPKYTSGV